MRESVAIPALRSATAAAVCLLVAEWLHIAEPGLAVWSCYIVTVQYTFTVFQKGVERIVGRGFGIWLALALATLTRNAWGLGFVLELALTLPLFYLYFSGRMAYTFLNAGLYLAAVMELSRTHPGSAVEEGWNLFGAIVVGVLVAVLVTWIFGEEKELTLRAEGQPLWPINRARVIHSVMLTVTVALMHLVSYWLQLSTSTVIVSVLLLTITPDYQTLLHKGQLRIAGAALAIVFATVAIMLLVRRPSFPLLLLALFLGSYLAAALARGSERWSYAGVQMGLVLPMILVVPQHEFGSLSGAFARVGGAIVAMLGSIVVGVAWAAVAPAPPLPIVHLTTTAGILKDNTATK